MSTPIPPSSPIPPGSSSSQGPQPTVIVRTVRKGGWLAAALAVLLCGSVLVNMLLITFTAQQITATTETSSLTEQYVSGDKEASDRIAIVEIDGTIMSPFTERTLKILKRIENDANVKGIVLAVESPGGFVADSQRIYDRLKALHETKGKKIYVSMGRLAASGGYYVAMGAGPQGKIYAEPATWTGSIGVIIPRYDVSKLASDYGVKSEPLVTGPFKDALSPFKELSPEEREVWKAIMDESYNEFVRIIDESREKLNWDQAKALATGQIYTAKQAVANGLVDGIKYRDDVVAELKEDLKMSKARVVRYTYPPSAVELLLGVSSRVTPRSLISEFLDASVPRAMYFFGWHPNLE